MVVGDRQAHRDLAIILLSQLTTVLPRHADRMSSFFGIPVSSMIQARIAPCRSIAGTTWARTADMTASSDQSALATKWCNDGSGAI